MKTAKCVYYYKSLIGFYKITIVDDILEGLSKVSCEGVSYGSSKILDKIILELDEYFLGKRKVFDIPIKLNGTDFQKRVWNALLEIPYGVCLSYKDIAKKIGSAGASRAVGNANGKNNIEIIVPCHRVVASNGLIGGYSCGIWVKEKLLDIENIVLKK